MMTPETGVKWWIRYVVVPLIGGGGVVALVVAAIQVRGNRAPANPAVELSVESKIDVGSAIFGTGDQSRRCDATDHVRRICDGATVCQLFPSNAMCGDPKKGTPKHLFVTYRCGDVGQPLLDLPEGKQGVITCSLTR